MKTDAELNRLIAERVMGYWVYHYDKSSREHCYYVLLDKDMNTVAPFDSREGINTGHRKTEAGAWADTPEYTADPIARETLINHLIEQDYAVTLYARHRLRSAEVLHAPTHSRLRKDDATEIGRALVLATLAAYGVEVE